MNSAIYTGVLRQSFNQTANRVAFMYLDLAETGRDLLAEKTRMLVMKEKGRRPKGPIRVLAPVRYFGLKSAESTFYYCFNAADTALEFIVVKVADPAKKERQTLVFECDPANQRWARPFAAEDSQSELPEASVWNFNCPNPTSRDAQLKVSLENWSVEERQPVSFAKLNLVSRPWLSFFLKVIS